MDCNRPFRTCHGEGKVPGYELLDDLMENIYNDPDHNLSVEDAVRYIQFFGLEVTPINDGIMRIVCQEVVRALEKAILHDGYTLTKTEKENVNEIQRSENPNL